MSRSPGCPPASRRRAARSSPRWARHRGPGARARGYAAPRPRTRESFSPACRRWRPPSPPTVSGNGIRNVSRTGLAPPAPQVARRTGRAHGNCGSMAHAASPDRRNRAPTVPPRGPIPTWYFALVVVRRGHRFLLTQERKYGATWSSPGGRVEPGETLASAAIREVLEETGVPAKLDGVLRVEHSPGEASARIRVIFLGSPLDDTEPKTEPDHEPLCAAYLTLDEIRDRPLRGAELRVLLETVADGCQVFPLDLLGTEMSV